MIKDAIATLFDIIKRLEEQLLNESVRKNDAKVSELLADDFIEYGSSGLIYDKYQVIDGLRTESYQELHLHNFCIKELATDVILATYIAVQKVNDNKLEESFSLRSSIWKCHHDNWQMVFHQGTPMPSSLNTGIFLQ